MSVNLNFMPGAARSEAPASFIEDLKAAAEKPAEMASVDLLRLLARHLALPVPLNRECSYLWAPFQSNGERRGSQRKISKSAVANLGTVEGRPANRVSKDEEWAPKRGSAQYQPVDYQLVVNGVVFPAFQYLVSGEVVTPTGLRAAGMVPGNVRFSQGFLRIKPATNAHLHAIMELHPQNVGGVMNVARETGAWPWLDISIMRGEKAMEDWHSGRFWFKPEGRDDKALKAARRAEEDAKAIAALTSVPVTVLKSIAMACNVSLPKEAIGQPDQRPFLIEALKGLVESTDIHRNADRSRLADMVGGRHKGFQREVEEAISAGVLLIEGGEFILVEGSRRIPLDGVIVTANMAGREAEVLALAIMQSDALDEFHARMLDATRVATSKSRGVEEHVPSMVEMLEELQRVGVINIDKTNMCWLFKNAEGYDDKVAYFQKHMNTATRFQELVKWAERTDSAMERVKAAYENSN